MAVILNRVKSSISADKINAFLIHLLISSFVVSIVLVLIFYFWYPQPYFEANGAWRVLRILIGVDLVLGPLLTLVLFKKGKKGLIFDLCFVAAIQLTALTYGIYVIYGERPYYLVFAVDRFELVSKVEIDDTQIKFPELKIKPNQGPILIYAQLPENKELRSKLLFEVATEGKPDLERRPEYYQLYELNKEKVVNKGKSLDSLVNADIEKKKTVNKFISKHVDNKEDFVYLPLVGKNNDLALVISKSTGLPIGGISLDPWLN